MPVVKDLFFRRGYRFSRFAGQAGAVTRELDVPSSVILPLKQGFGSPVACVVKEGDRVNAGQAVGRDDRAVGSPVLASV